MTRGVPMLDPKRDLAGATPEKLAAPCCTTRYDRAHESSPLQATRSRRRRFRPTIRATVSRIWASVSESRMLCLPANSET